MGKWRTYTRRGGSGGPGVIDNYVAAIAAVGGSIDATGLAAVTALYRTLAATGVWDRLGEVWPCAGNALTAALVKLKVWPGAPTSYGNVAFVGGDYTQIGGTGGLTADGATKYLTGGPTMTDLATDCSMTSSCRAGFTGAGNRFLMGVFSGGDQYWLGSLNPAASVAGRLGVLVTATYAVPAAAALWTITRASTSSLILYEGSVNRASDATVAAPGVNAIRSFLFAANSAGVPAGFIPARMSGACYGRSLSPSQMTVLSEAWTAFDLALTR